MLTCPSISLTLTPGVMREKHEKLVSFTIYKLSSFQHGTTLDVCWGYWLAQVPLTSTHKHIWNVISVFFLSPKHRNKSRHLNIFLFSFLSYNVYVLCKQTYSCSYGASLHFAHIFYSKWYSRDAKIISPEIVFECIMLKIYNIFFVLLLFLFFYFHCSFLMMASRIKNTVY